MTTTTRDERDFYDMFREHLENEEGFCKRLDEHLVKQANVISDLGAHITQLRERLAKLESMVEQMWFAPGMPGAEEAALHFRSLSSSGTNYTAGEGDRPRGEAPSMMVVVGSTSGVLSQ